MVEEESDSNSQETYKLSLTPTIPLSTSLLRSKGKTRTCPHNVQLHRSSNDSTIDLAQTLVSSYIPGKSYKHVKVTSTGE